MGAGFTLVGVGVGVGVRVWVGKGTDVTVGAGVCVGNGTDVTVGVGVDDGVGVEDFGNESSDKVLENPIVGSTFKYVPRPVRPTIHTCLGR
jgi:hypothetical protein